MAKSKITSSLDIGSSKTAVLISQFREDELEPKINIIGVSTVKSKGVRKGQIVNIEEAVATINEAVEAAERMAGYNISKVWVSVGGAHINSQNSHGVVAVAQPQGEINAEDARRVLEAARAVSLPSSHEILHVLPRQYTVDSQEGVKDPSGMTGVRLEVDTHIVTGSSPVIKNLTKCVSEIGCDVQGLVFSGLAASKAVLSDTEQELGVVLVDIGGGTMSLAIFIEGALSYSRILPVGAINVTKDLAAGLRISLESAEVLKIFIGQDKSKEDEIDITSLHLPEEIKTVSKKTLVEGIIRPRLNEMFALINSSIKDSNLGGLTPSGLVITGGGALTVGLIDSAKRLLGMPVRIGTPSDLTGLVDEINSPSFATPVGLIRHARKSQEESDLGRPGLAIPTFSGLDKIPVKSMLGKVGGWVKSLLP